MSFNHTNEHLKKVYVGNLHGDTTENLLCTLFSQFGLVNRCKIVKESTTTEKFAFIEYDDHAAAEMAIATMNGRVFLEKKIKVSWANTFSPNGSGMGDGADSSLYYTIFVGDVSREVTEADLQNVFANYGEITDCRIIRDRVTSKCKHYAFITFVSKEAAEIAIKDMNGFWIGNRSIRTNWARKNLPLYAPNPTYQEVESQTGPTNTTIYCGNVTRGISEELLKNLFDRFGPISAVRVFIEKGYGFVNFCEKSSAVNAILEMNRYVVDGDVIRVSWGKEPYTEGTVANYSGSSYYNWQNLQGYQNAYAMLLQQQSFYQTNAALTNPCTFYSYYGQPYSYSGASAEVGNTGNPQYPQPQSRQDPPYPSRPFLRNKKSKN